MNIHKNARRAYIIYHHQTSGGRMFAQAFVAAGCFGDPQFSDKPLAHLSGHWQRLDMIAADTPERIPARAEIPDEVFAEYFPMHLDAAPNVIVWRRSIPHGSEWMEECQTIYHRALAANYQPIVVVPWRIPCTTEKFIKERGTWEYRREGFHQIMQWLNDNNIDPVLVNYDAFVLSRDYRAFVARTLKLPDPWSVEKLNYSHAGLKWGDTQWAEVGQWEAFTS